MCFTVEASYTRGHHSVEPFDLAVWRQVGRSCLEALLDVDRAEHVAPPACPKMSTEAISGNVPPGSERCGGSAQTAPRRVRLGVRSGRSLWEVGQGVTRGWPEVRNEGGGPWGVWPRRALEALTLFGSFRCFGRGFLWRSWFWGSGAGLAELGADRPRTLGPALQRRSTHEPRAPSAAKLPHPHSGLRAGGPAV